MTKNQKLKTKMELPYPKLREADLANPARCYLLIGAEESLKKEFIQRLRGSLKILPGSLDETVLDAREAGADSILGSALTVPMESERRLVLVRRANRLQARDLQGLVKRVAQLPDWSCLVLWVEPEADETSGAEGRKVNLQSLTEAVKQQGVVLQFTPLAGAELEKRLIARATQEGKKLTPVTARYLLSLVDGVAERALAELEKALYFVDPRQEITEHDLDQVVSPSREARVFALVEAIAEGKPGVAMERLHELFQTGTRAEEVALKTLALIARQYRLLWQARLLIEKGYSLHRPEQIPKEVTQKLPKEPNLVQVLLRQAFLRSRLQRQAERVSRSQLCAAFDAIKRADLALKGMEPGVGALEIMERLVINLARL